MFRVLTRNLGWVVASLLAVLPAHAGPPYVADDPQPTDFRHYEIYFFASSQGGSAGNGGAAGIDFNYGGAPDLQLTTVLPVAYGHPAGRRAVSGLGNIELAAKYRFLHQSDWGWDVAVFPRIFLRSTSGQVGNQHASYLLPVWLQRDWGNWSTFGGGGCELNRGDDSRSFCQWAWALARQFTPDLQIGAELQHQGADAAGARPSTGIGLGLHFDATPNLHLLGYASRGVQNTTINRYSTYAALLLTF
ncbi:MAG: hypothetical protein E6R07_08315 [Nevskiaceae bacterium]|nr:MAG: hypothetical protein E6R07_08315 [Nevskiaceae bacterium]